ncbi:MAG: helix-turn-helix domain-containing protein, partial [Verrucomicrobia bacterium]|nr:helix-turn-helix domain-containing protein [Verrucomicrobiota bacterium]
VITRAIIRYVELSRAFVPQFLPQTPQFRPSITPDSPETRHVPSFAWAGDADALPVPVSERAGSSVCPHMTVMNTNGEISMATNKRMKAARALRGLTQRDLAERIGRREIDVSRIETGRVQPDREIRQRIAAMLRVSTFEIFDA